MSGSQWTKEEEMRLRQLVDTIPGISASKLMEYFEGYTRNAILGKLWRLGIKSNGERVKPPRPARPYRYRPPKRTTPTISLGDVEEPGPVQAGNLDLTGLAPTSFLDLRFDQCRFILSDDGKFCPLKQQHKSPYCEYHHKVTHVCAR